MWPDFDAVKSQVTTWIGNNKALSAGIAAGITVTAAASDYFLNTNIIGWTLAAATVTGGTIAALRNDTIREWIAAHPHKVLELAGIGVASVVGLAIFAEFGLFYSWKTIGATVSAGLLGAGYWYNHHQEGITAAATGNPHRSLITPEQANFGFKLGAVVLGGLMIGEAFSDIYQYALDKTTFFKPCVDAGWCKPGAAHFPIRTGVLAVTVGMLHNNRITNYIASRPIPFVKRTFIAAAAVLTTLAAERALKNYITAADLRNIASIGVGLTAGALTRFTIGGGAAVATPREFKPWHSIVGGLGILGLVVAAGNIPKIVSGFNWVTTEISNRTPQFEWPTFQSSPSSPSAPRGNQETKTCTAQIEKSMPCTTQVSKLSDGSPLKFYVKENGQCVAQPSNLSVGTLLTVKEVVNDNWLLVERNDQEGCVGRAQLGNMLQRVKHG